MERFFLRRLYQVKHWQWHHDMGWWRLGRHSTKDYEKRSKSYNLTPKDTRAKHWAKGVQRCQPWEKYQPQSPWLLSTRIWVGCENDRENANCEQSFKLKNILVLSKKPWKQLYYSAIGNCCHQPLLNNRQEVHVPHSLSGVATKKQKIHIPFQVRSFSAKEKKLHILSLLSSVNILNSVTIFKFIINRRVAQSVFPVRCFSFTLALGREAGLSLEPSPSEHALPHQVLSLTSLAPVGPPSVQSPPPACHCVLAEPQQEMHGAPQPH